MAVARSTSLTLANITTEEVFIDATRVEDAKESVKKDLTNIVTEIDAIKKAYNTLAKNSKTTGSWKSTANAAVKAATTYHTNLVAARRSLESSINSSVIEYVLTQINELQKAQASAEQINTNA